MDCTLPKSERLHGDKAVQNLFASRQSMMAFPFRVVYRFREDEEPARLFISVPKKRFKHAVDRNRVKRLLREAYRHQKPALSVDIAFLFVGEQLPDLPIVQAAVTQALQRLEQKHG